MAVRFTVSSEIIFETQEQKYVKNCPKCGGEIVYKNARCLKQSANKSCRLCANEAVRQKTRTLEHRKLKSEQSSALWADKESTFNSVEYRDKLSTGHLRYYANMTDEQREDHRQMGRQIWIDHRDKMLTGIRRGTSTESCRKKRHESIKRFWAEHPEAHIAQSIRASSLMLDPVYKKKCTEKLIEAAQRTSGTSKQEQALIPILSAHGFKHKVKLLDHWWVDFFNPETNVIVEYFGDWWHCHPRFWKRIDEKYHDLHPTHGKSYDDIIRVTSIV